MFVKKLSFFLKKNQIEAGCDEAGRGCLAGPVVAAAVILDPKNPILGLNDSKKLTINQRTLLKEEIQKKALAFGIGIIVASKIDEINILNASILAMHKAIDLLKIKPDSLIIDGNRFHSYKNIPHTTIIKGDEKFQSIAAASILAKTFRDDLMEKLHDEFPAYNWKKNKGYPTLFHRKTILEIGASNYHRKSFQVST